MNQIMKNKKKKDEKTKSFKEEDRFGWMELISCSKFCSRTDFDVFKVIFSLKKVLKQDL